LAVGRQAPPPSEALAKSELAAINAVALRARTLAQTAAAQLAAATV
jgi:hypothetical protein